VTRERRHSTTWPSGRAPVSRSALEGELKADDGFLSRSEVWALVGCQPLAQLSNQALLPSLGAMRADLDLSYAELGWVVAAFGVARLGVDLPAGGLASRWNPRSVLILALAASAVGSSMGIFAANAWQIATVRLLIGVGSSIAQAMILAWLVGGSGRAARGRVLARSEAFFSLSGLFIPALGGMLAGPLGWRVAFVLGALAAGVGLLSIVLGTRSSSAARSLSLSTAGDSPGVAQPAGWLDLRAGGKVLLAAYLATFVVFFCRNGMLNAIFPVLGAERLGVKPFEIGLLFSVINAVGIGAVLLGGRCGDRFGRYRMVLPGLALLTVAQALLFTIHDPLTYVIVGLVQGLACFINPLPTIVMGDALTPRLRARGIAVYRAVCDLAVLSAPASLGMALQVSGFGGAELVSLAVCLIALGSVTLLYVFREHRAA
jgi:MFS transporter, DHA1 family, multidrug resistance protein